MIGDRPSGPMDLVVFDCDGVLVDSEWIAQDVEMAHLHRLGWEIGEDEFRQRFTGIPTTDILHQGAEHLGISIEDDFIQGARTELRTRMQAVQAVEGAAETVASLECPTAIASNSSRAGLGMKLGACGLADMFGERTYGYEDVARGKPAPDLYLLACERAGIEPGRAFAVEDSVTGVTSARAAGLTVIGFVGGTHQSRKGAPALLQAGAACVAPDMAVLRAYFQTL